METRRIIDIYDDLGTKFPDVMYFVIHKAAELDEFFPHKHSCSHTGIADLLRQPGPRPRYCAFVVFKNPHAHPQLEILGEEVYALDEDTFIYLSEAYKAYPNVEDYFCFSMEHHVINIIHNYSDHNSPGLKVLTVSQTPREGQFENDVDIQIERGRETGHLMMFGMNGSFTFPCLLPGGGRLLLRILGWIRFGRENPHIELTYGIREMLCCGFQQLHSDQPRRHIGKLKLLLLYPNIPTKHPRSNSQTFIYYILTDTFVEMTLRDSKDSKNFCI